MAFQQVLQTYNGAKHNLSQREAKKWLIPIPVQRGLTERRDFIVRYGLGSISSPAVRAESQSALRILHLMKNRTLIVAKNFPYTTNTDLCFKSFYKRTLSAECQTNYRSLPF